jgi:hypothetical protein
MILTFNKENSRWYVELPSYPGPKEDLEMVAGADTLLDTLSNNGESITLEISESEINDSIKAVLLREALELNNGAIYTCLDSEIWLCDVMKFVFGYFPIVIYFKTI